MFALSILFFAPQKMYTNGITVAANVKNQPMIDEIVDLINAERNRNGLKNVVIDKNLQKVAQIKVEDMMEKKYFSHTSPEGLDLSAWMGKSDYAYSYAGENLARGYDNPKKLVVAWMDSFGHRQNILNKRFEDIGIGIIEGNYRGKETVFIAAYFGDKKNDYFSIFKLIRKHQ